MPRSTVLLSTILLLIAAAVSSEPYPGLTLVSPVDSRATSLIDMDGTVLRTWHAHGRPAHIAYLLEDGSILRPSSDSDGAFNAGGSGGVVEIIDPDDSVVWQYWFSNDEHQQQHAGLQVGEREAANPERKMRREEEPRRSEAPFQMRFELEPAVALRPSDRPVDQGREKQPPEGDRKRNRPARIRRRAGSKLDERRGGGDRQQTSEQDEIGSAL